MQSDSGHTTSVWMDTTEVPQFQSLTQDLRTNVCVVGAGIAGMTTAYLLARAGRAVVLIDDGPIGGGETSRTTAHLTAALVDRNPFSFWDSGPALRFPRQASIHPLKYLKGLARAILRDGGKIYTGVHAEKIEDGEPARVTTSEGRVISADNVVVCTNTPVNDWLIIHSKQAAYRTYVIGARVPKGAIPHGLYWDTPDPYHYIRLQSGEDKAGRELDYEILIVGGEDHKTGQAEDTEERFVRLEQWTRERFPM